MSKERIIEIANQADMIVRGYAFIRDGSFVHVFNINDGKTSVVIDEDGTLIASNANPIEYELIHGIWTRDAGYMEE